MWFSAGEIDPQDTGVYRIWSRDDNGVYVGAARNIFNRYKAHKSALIRGNHECAALQDMVARSGFKNLHFTVLESLFSSGVDLRTLEQRWLNHYNSSDQHRLLNTLPQSQIKPIRASRGCEFKTEAFKIPSHAKQLLCLIALATKESMPAIILRLVEAEALERCIEPLTF